MPRGANPWRYHLADSLFESQATVRLAFTPAGGAAPAPAATSVDGLFEGCAIITYLAMKSAGTVDAQTSPNPRAYTFPGTSQSIVHTPQSVLSYIARSTAT